MISFMKRALGSFKLAPPANDNTPWLADLAA